jgi:hypothetical protein
MWAKQPRSVLLIFDPKKRLVWKGELPQVGEVLGEG